MDNLLMCLTGFWHVLFLSSDSRTAISHSKNKLHAPQECEHVLLTNSYVFITTSTAVITNKNITHKQQKCL